MGEVLSLQDFLTRAASRQISEFDTGSGIVFMRPTNNATRSKIDALLTKENKTAKDCSDLRWITIKECLVNADGEPWLSASHRELYDSWDTSFTEPIFDEALRLMKLTADEREELKKN